MNQLEYFFLLNRGIELHHNPEQFLKEVRELLVERGGWIPTDSKDIQDLIVSAVKSFMRSCDTLCLSGFSYHDLDAEDRALVDAVITPEMKETLVREGYFN